MSSVITPPALRSTCASPSPSPSAANTSRRESMHVTTARRRLGRTSRWRSDSEAANTSLLASSSSIVLSTMTLYVLARIFGRMATGMPLEMTLLPGARALLALHAREAPQRDDLCGAFCGVLALGAAGIAAGADGGEPIDQDAVVLAAAR